MSESMTSKICYQDDDLTLVASKVTKGEDKQKNYLLAICDSPESRRRLARRRHDFIGALRTLDLAIASIAKGYQFNDQMASRKQQAMASALSVLCEEAKLFHAVLGSPEQD